MKKKVKLVRIPRLSHSDKNASDCDIAAYDGVKCAKVVVGL